MIILKNYGVGAKYLHLTLSGYDVILKEIAGIPSPPPPPGEDSEVPEYLEGSEILGEKSLDISAYFKPRTTFAIFKDIYGNFLEPINVTDMYMQREGKTLFQTRNHIASDQILTFYFYDTPSQFFLLTFMPTQTPNEYIVRDWDEGVADIIRDIFPDHAKTVTIMNARKDLVFGLQPNEILAGQEAQLDIVTHLTLAMYNVLTDEQKAAIAAACPALNGFRILFDEVNVCNIKPHDKCLEEMAFTKRKVRTLQETYFAVREENQ